MLFDHQIVTILNILSIIIILFNFNIFLYIVTACRKVLLLAGLAVPLLLTRVAFMSVVALARTRSIYIITFPVIVLLIIISNFGWQAILSSVECYDPETDKWTKLVHMKKVDSTN